MRLLPRVEFPTMPGVVGHALSTIRHIFGGCIAIKQDFNEDSGQI